MSKQLCDRPDYNVKVVVEKSKGFRLWQRVKLTAIVFTSTFLGTCGLIQLMR